MDACYRFTRKLREHKGTLDACIASVLTSLHDEVPEFGEHVAINGSDLPAYAKGSASSPRAGGWGFGSPTPMPPCATTPEGYSGQLFSRMAKHLPAPPEGTDPPVRWGDAGVVRERFQPFASSINTQIETITFRWESRQAARNYIERNSGAIVAAKRWTSAQQFDEMVSDLESLTAECSRAPGANWWSTNTTCSSQKRRYRSAPRPCTLFLIQSLRPRLPNGTSCESPSHRVKQLRDQRE